MADDIKDIEARGKRLLQFRKSLSMSRREFGELFGIPHSTLQHYEIGRGAGIPYNKAKQLCQKAKDKGYDLAFSWLFHGTASTSDTSVISMDVIGGCYVKNHHGAEFEKILSDDYSPVILANSFVGYSALDINAKQSVNELAFIESENEPRQLVYLRELLGGGEVLVELLLDGNRLVKKLITAAYKVDLVIRIPQI